MLWLSDGAGQQRAHPVDRGGTQVVVRHLHLEAAGAQPVGEQHAGVNQVAGCIQGVTAAGLLQVVVRPETNSSMRRATTTGTPRWPTAYTSEPMAAVKAIVPELRTRKRSPKFVSNCSSTGTRESAHPSTAA